MLPIEHRGHAVSIRRVLIVACLCLAALIVLGAIFIKSRGFRASSAPGRLEAKVARSVRNFSIPRAESRQTNPLADDPVALQQGRDAFLSRCAACHGIDGRGLTPI